VVTVVHLEVDSEVCLFVIMLYSPAYGYDIHLPLILATCNWFDWVLEFQAMVGCVVGGAVMDALGGLGIVVSALVGAVVSALSFPLLSILSLGIIW